MTAPAPAPAPPPRAGRQPLCERNFFLSGVLFLFSFGASIFAGLLAARLIVPGSHHAYLLAGFMLPLGWALGWQGVRHLYMSCLIVAAPFLLPVLIVWLLYRWIRRKPLLGGSTTTGWRPDPTLFLIAPSCALTAAITGAVGAFEAELPYGRSIGLLSAVGAGWGLMLALLQYRGVLPDEDRSVGAGA